MRLLRLARTFRRGSPGDCAELRKHATDYLEGDLPEVEKRRILQHLEECERCSSFLDTLRSTLSMLRKLSSRAMPASLKEKLFQIPGRGQSTTP